MKLLIIALIFFSTNNILAQDPLVFKNLNFDITYGTDTSNMYFFETLNNKRIILYGDSAILPDAGKRFSIGKVTTVNFQNGGQGWLGALGGALAGGLIGMVIELSNPSTGHGGGIGPILIPLGVGLVGSLVGGYIGTNFIPRFTSHNLEGYTPSEKIRLLKKYLKEYKLD